MSSPITAAIQEGRPYLDRFMRREYEKAFRAYEKAYWGPCLQALDAAREDLPALAEQVLDELQEGRRRTRFWNRGAQSFDEKHTVIKYLAPMLLEHGEEAFAQLLKDAWCHRWPKDPYEQTSFGELRKGFVNVILGIQLKDKNE